MIEAHPDPLAFRFRVASDDCSTWWSESVPKWNPRPSAKRRTRAHVIADLSVNHVERHILRCGWSVERLRHDYGIDLYMQTFSPSGEGEPGIVLLQVKATDKLRWNRDRTGVAVRVEWRDVLAWCKEIMPVILVLYDAVSDKAYWVHVQASYAGTRRDVSPRSVTTTVRIPTSQELSESAVLAFSRLHLDALSRLPRVVFHDEE